MINKKIDEISAKLETIKVLVQDNEYLSKVEKSCEAVNKRNQILENRIQKAIEYINKYSGSLMFDLYMDVFEELLDILKGDNNG